MTKTNDNQPQSESTRIYALDALRAVMMLLGIVIHVSITYGRVDYGPTWPLTDKNNNPVFDLLVALIHTFRMPLFFTTSGYFGALLFYKKGPKAMIINRVKRILFPFILAVILVHPIVVFAIEFSHASISGTPSPFMYALKTMGPDKFIPLDLAHLWFLYFLMMFSVLIWLLALAFRRNTIFNLRIITFFTNIFQKFWLRQLSMFVFLFMAFIFMHSTFFYTSTLWSFAPRIFTTYIVFFLTGWILYKTNSLFKLDHFPFLQLGVALTLFLINYYASWPDESWVPLAQKIVISIYSTLFIFGFFAFFLRYFNTYSPKLSYIMEASYWVYIIHLPIVTFIPGLLAGFDVPSVVKFTITMVLTSAICLVSYEYFVRKTFIGLFLNGKVHKRKKKAVILQNEIKAEHSSI